jgi:hypothetical protein
MDAVGEERREEEDDMRSTRQRVEMREVVGAFWTIHKYGGVRMGPITESNMGLRESTTYKMGNNYNCIFANM